MPSILAPFSYATICMPNSQLSSLTIESSSYDTWGTLGSCLLLLAITVSLRSIAFSSCELLQLLKRTKMAASERCINSISN